MKFLKSLLCMALVLCMCMGVLAACTKSESPAPPPTESTPVPEQPGLCADGHTPCAWTVDTPATLSTDGEAQSICAVCGALLSAEPIAKLQASTFQGVTFSAQTTQVNLRDYTLVYPYYSSDGNSFTGTFTRAMSALADTLTAVSGKAFTAGQQSSASTSGCKIMVGNFRDNASTQALAAFGGEHGYGVFLMGERIWILGTTDLLTLRAVELFVQKYLSSVNAGGISLHNSALSAPVEMTLVADGEHIAYTILRSAELDEDPGVEYGSTGGKEYVDYPVNAVKTLQNKLKSLAGISTLSKNAWAKDSVERTALELMVGKTNREDSAKALAKLQGHEYGIFISGDGRIVLNAWNDTNLMYCVERFTDYLTESRCRVNGQYCVLLPTDFSEIGSANAKWVTDIPKPSKSVLVGTVDVEDSSLEYVYSGEDVNAAAYLGYCELLKQKGYTVMQESGNMEDSYFTTMVNQEAGVYLYVAFNAFKYANKLSESAAYAADDACIRIVCAPLSAVNLPTAQMLSFTPFTQCRNPITSLSAISMKTAGTGYIMRLEDGSFIVMDGGTVNEGTEVQNVWDMLCQMHTDAYGVPPSQDNPIRISAWIISHNHGDHYNLLFSLAKEYGQSGLLKIDYLLGNFPAAATYYNTPESGSYVQTNMSKLQSYLTYPLTYIKVHTGQRLWFANVEVEVMFTHEDFYPHPIVAFNDSSTVVRLHTLVTNGKARRLGNTPVSFLFTGDMYRYSARWMCAMYGKYLESDMVALAHHGGPGAESTFYGMVNARALWVPNTTAAFNGWLSKTNWTGAANKMAVICANTQYVFCANYVDGVYRNVTVEFGVFGPRYDHATNPGGQGEIVYGTVSSSGKLPGDCDCAKKK